MLEALRELHKNPRLDSNAGVCDRCGGVAKKLIDGKRICRRCKKDEVFI